MDKMDWWNSGWSYRVPYGANNTSICKYNTTCRVERVTFGWKWKFKLLQANMDVCHTQEQQIFRFRVFYVTNYQLILTFVLYKFHYLKMVPKRVKNSTFCKFIHNTTCVYWNDALRFHSVIWIFWDSVGWQNQIS